MNRKRLVLCQKRNGCLACVSPNHVGGQMHDDRIQQQQPRGSWLEFGKPMHASAIAANLICSTGSRRTLMHVTDNITFAKAPDWVSNNK
jgi:hypothetical protein